VDLRLQDYRSVHGTFDRVVSIGMLEHVGWRNHRRFMEVVHRCLEREGIAVLHTIGANESQKHGIPFFEKYVFPNAASPSIAQLGRAMENLFVLEDVHNIGPDYRPTLLSWWRNFDAGYPTLDQKKYDRRFYRMWRFYLLAAAGAVAARESQLWHLVLTHIGQPRPDCRVG
jgi:cyclopropane-fatty-acyl-phospholipid synthase